MNATDIVRINQMVEDNKMSRECFYRVAAPCSHPQCLDRHWDQMRQLLERGRNSISKPSLTNYTKPLVDMAPSTPTTGDDNE